MRCDPQVTCLDGQASAAGRRISRGCAFGESAAGMPAADGAKGGRAADEGVASADAFNGAWWALRSMPAAAWLASLANPLPSLRYFALAGAASTALSV